MLKKNLNENIWWRFWQLLGEEKIITFLLQYTNNQKDVKIWLKEIISTLDDKREKAACLKQFFIQNERYRWLGDGVFILMIVLLL